MQLTTLKKLIFDKNIFAFLRLGKQVDTVYRTSFVTAANSSGLLNSLNQGEQSLIQLQQQLTIDDTKRDALEAWLECGVRLGELGFRTGRYRLKGKLSRHLAKQENQIAAAMFEEAIRYHYDALLSAPVRMKQDKAYQLSDQDGKVIAQSSQILEPFVEEAIEWSLKHTQPKAILEVGCGAGKYLVYLRDRLASSEIIAIDYQADVAKMMGFGDHGKVAVEKMMKRFFRLIARVAELNKMLLHHFERQLMPASHSPKVIEISDDFIVEDGLLKITRSRLFSRPAKILELFLHVAQTPEIKDLHPETLRLLRNARRRLISRMNDYVECRRLFVAIIKHPRGLGLALNLMHRYSIIGAYLPQWRNIVGQMQFDLFHAYSVDEHSYRLIKNLYRFSQPEHNHEFPLCSKIVQRTRKPELLYFAGIFHDIAKGRGGDHAKLGAIDALAFAKEHDLSAHDGRMIAWLVEQHLLMSVTAQRKDISDETVIRTFAEVVKDEARLDLLYCLTVADMRATNESLWNSWKANLLEELYNSTKRAFRLGLEKPVDLRAKIRENQAQALEVLINEHGLHEEQIKHCWKDFRTDYFLRYLPDQIQWHTRHIIAVEKNEPLILISPEPYRGGTEVFIYTKDLPHIFARTTALLGQKKLLIHDAKIITSKNGYTLNTFVILDQYNKPINDEHRAQEIVDSLQRVLSKSSANDIQVQPIPRKNEQFVVNTSVNFSKTTSKNRTMLEIISMDRPSLLASIGQVFQDQKLVIHSAKITTFGERAEDVFTVSNEHGTTLTDQEKEMLRIRLCHDLD